MTAGRAAIREALVHILFVRDWTLDRSGGQGELHQLFKLCPDHAKVPVRHTIRRIFHHELQNLGS